MGCPHLKMKSPHPQPPLKSEVTFQEMIPRKKKPQKLETVINTCVSIIKQPWKKMVEIPWKRDFLAWNIQNFVRKVKQFVRKYYITWLIELANKSCGAEKFLISFYAICY